ncbi:hypothetical protein ACNKHS_16965 [Shigella flexneri]
MLWVPLRRQADPAGSASRVGRRLLCSRTKKKEAPR